MIGKAEVGGVNSSIIHATSAVINGIAVTAGIFFQRGRGSARSVCAHGKTIMGETPKYLNDAAKAHPLIFLIRQYSGRGVNASKLSFAVIFNGVLTINKLRDWMDGTEPLFYLFGCSGHQLLQRAAERRTLSYIPIYWNNKALFLLQ